MKLIHGCSCFLIGCISVIFINFLGTFLQNGHELRSSDTLTSAVSSCLKALGLLHERGLPRRTFTELSLVPEDLDIFSSYEDEISFLLPNERTDKLNKKDVETSSPANIVEAEVALHAALELRNVGKYEKANRLLKHALALAPSHPDVLTHYGEFVEEANRNLVEADYLYTRALSFSPKHSRALENRKRTMPLVEELDERLLYRIEMKRNEILRVPDSSAALKRIKKEAYFQHIYHTVGIEGNTMSLAQTRMIVETRMAVGGKSLMEHNEILGMDSALRYINSSLLHKMGEITLNDILEIHKRVLGHVDPTEGGTLRRSQVFVSDHIPPPPSEIKSQMSEFIEWLNSPETVDLHPVKYAALAHYKLVYIHPFSDGNGRTSRLLMNLILMQAGYPPVIIRKQDRLKYYETLKAANEGDVRPFIRFIAESAEQTLDVYLWAIGNKSVPIPVLALESSDRKIIVDNMWTNLSESSELPRF